MKKIIAIFSSVVGLLTFAVVSAFAHVVVTPHQIGVAATQDFTLSVPNEKDNPVIAVRLLIPDGVNSVVPNAEPGWSIDTKTSGSGDNETVTEIDWNGGSIPVGQRAEFVFQAQVPAKPTTIAWNAYQTYSNGTVVSWDVDPATLKNLSDSQQDDLANKQNKGEYSTTQVINDLTGSSTNTSMTAGISVSNADLVSKMKWLMLVSGGALVLSISGIVLALRKKIN